MRENRLILIRTGKGKMIFDNKAFSFSPGTIVFAFEGETCTIVTDDQCEYMYIQFSGERANSLFRRYGITETSRSFNGFDAIIPLWLDSLSTASSSNIDLAAESMLLYTLSKLNCDTSAKNTIVNRIVAITEENFTNPELSVTSIADELSYNPKYISHIFKETMGIGYNEYLRTFRIKYAVSLLNYGIDSVKNVAFLCGFTDPMYFSTVFKKTVGISPKNYKLKKNN